VCVRGGQGERGGDLPNYQRSDGSGLASRPFEAQNLLLLAAAAHCLLPLLPLLLLLLCMQVSRAGRRGPAAMGPWARGVRMTTV